MRWRREKSWLSAAVALAAGSALFLAATSSASSAFASSASASSPSLPALTASANRPSALEPRAGLRAPASSLGDLLTYDYDNARSGHDTVDPPIKNLSSRP